MKILLTSIIDLKNSQHNRPHEFVKHLSKRHEITVLSIKDWWKAEQIQHGKHSDDIGRYLVNVDYQYLSLKRINPSLQEILYLNKMNELVKNNYDVHLNYNSLLIGNQFSKRIRTLFDLADDLVAMIKTSPQLPNVLRSYAAYFGNFLLMDTIKSANRVSVTTPALTKSYYIPEEKLTVIPNGVDTSLFMDRGDAKKDLGF
ncbi:MAG: hypothetical protein LUP94_02150, partial [Candidatus Methanomethylicus sp.]|nr:hypothetical protein [Candidatus Methanomethylicus sp.]